MSEELEPSLDPLPPPDAERTRQCKTFATVVYALQAVSVLVLGITLVVAVVVSYVKKSDAEGSWLESYFRWQIRTFWFALLWTVVGLVLAFAGVGTLILIANLVWLIFRIVKGWIYLSEGKEMYRTA